MRFLGSYLLIFYGVLTVGSVGSAVREGRVAPAGGMVLALDGITMIFSAFGVLIGLKWAIAVAIGSIAIRATLAAYNAYVLDGGLRPRKQTARIILSLMLIALFVFGN